ncbi:C2 and GRAM domain-containing protein At5g50170 [Coffea eugenioides]|uniref:C2 and GRAM domain-containing protein At5g50170 n=1 Tax=Coffea eugenioides TaxID=49369 RepID=UPI000F60AAC3|nr:C2 and GRAM domain-containing protein At5g50170 [Coffea eugenioides]
MRLFVYLLEGRDLAVKDSYVKLKVGKSKSKTRVLKNTRNPVWNEEFVFRVHDLEDELVLSVYQFNEDSGFFNLAGDLVGRVKIPAWFIVAEKNHYLPPTWFSLQKRKSLKSTTNKDYGKVLLTLSLQGRGEQVCSDHLLYVHPSCRAENTDEYGNKCVSSQDIFSCTPPTKKILEGKHLVKVIAGRLEKLFNKNEDASGTEDSSELSTTISDNEENLAEPTSNSNFEELIEMLQSSNEQKDMPENLEGGILLDQAYAIPPKDLNLLLFAPKSQFMRDLAELQGTMDVQEGPWTWKSADKSCLARVVTYTKTATKLVKTVKATEEQTYIKANGKEFIVFVDVNTPEVPYGNTFKVDLLYKITPGPELFSIEKSAHLVISWALNFHQSTMMNGLIERGARQGLKESFEQFSDLLAKNLKVINLVNMSDKGHMVATLQEERQSDWELATEYFWNFTVAAALFMVLYIGFHIWLCGEFKLQGLEFDGLDLPDSVGEIITSAILVIQLEKVYDMVSHFVQSRLKRGSDHGVKAQGDGWVLTIALIEGAKLASLDSTELPDPYVVVTCNGKSRTSSVKLQTLDPHWNEILEFDASEEPPSVLDVEVLDFDGPFDQACSLGHAEINFLKHTSTELADIWVPLDGKLAQSSQSKLHLRIFLNNTNGAETIRDYLKKMEKEVGKKLNLRSPHRNSAFQKIFGLPPEEFLISDFSCSLKRKMPLQGRLFLSARIVGFYANLFGHKTKFFFLWEDIEHIHELPPTVGTVGSPSLVIILSKGHGNDARHGAKYQDEEGRLHFYFHSFISFNVASRTVMALWRTRTLGPDQRAQIAEEQQDRDEKPSLFEDPGSYLIVQDAKLAKVLSVELPVNIRLVLQMFDGGDFEYKVMAKSGCLNYTTTPWEPVTPDVLERRTSYKFDRSISVFGGEVTCTQQKMPLSSDGGWIVNEIMTLHDVPFSEYFRVQLKYELENSALAQGTCKCDAYVGVAWLKSTKFEERITRNVVRKFTQWSKEVLQLVEREILLATT